MTAGAQSGGTVRVVSRRLWAPAALVATLALAFAPPSSAQSVAQILELLDGGRENLYLRLRNGEWSYQSPRVPTAAWKFTGHITVLSPLEGKWRVQLIDLVRPPERGYPPVLDQIVEANQVVPFSYRTGGTAQLFAQVNWSRRTDAIAKVEIAWNGCLCVLGAARRKVPPDRPGEAPGAR